MVARLRRTTSGRRATLMELVALKHPTSTVRGIMIGKETVNRAVAMKLPARSLIASEKTTMEVRMEGVKVRLMFPKRSSGQKDGHPNNAMVAHRRRMTLGRKEALVRFVVIGISMLIHLVTIGK